MGLSGYFLGCARARRLSPGAKDAYLWMCARAWDPGKSMDRRPDGQYDQGHTELAYAMGLIEQQEQRTPLTRIQSELVRRAVQELMARQLVTRTKKAVGGKPPEYQLNFDLARLPSETHVEDEAKVERAARDAIARAKVIALGPLVWSQTRQKVHRSTCPNTLYVPTNWVAAPWANASEIKCTRCRTLPDSEQETP